MSDPELEALTSWPSEVAQSDLVEFFSLGLEDRRWADDQTAQAHCLTLVVNICVLSTTWYIQDALDAQRADGPEISDQAIAHISPARPGVINPYGTHNIDVAGILDRGHRRPLRAPKRR